MSFGTKILIGALCGLVFGFFTVVSSINNKAKLLENKWELLAQALCLRYVRLADFLGLLINYLPDMKDEIASLIEICRNASKIAPSNKNIGNFLLNENTINYRLENIKIIMNQNSAINEDENINGAISAIIESETNVANAIKIYNNEARAYGAFLEAFPINLAAAILGIKPSAALFQVTPVEEFDDNYIDEDEI